MSTVLKNILSFTGLVVGVPTSIAHLINVNGLAKKPQLVFANAAGYTITADTINITVTRLSGGAASVNVYCEFWHSIEDAEPPGGISPSSLPFTLQSSGGSGSSSFPNEFGATVFEWNDDWLMGAQLAQGNGWNGIPIGTPPYTLTLNGLNTALTPATGTERIGVITLDTGTTNTGEATLTTVASCVLAPTAPGGVGGPQQWEGVLKWPLLSTALEEFSTSFGLQGNAPGYGCLFLYDRGNVGIFGLPGINPGNLDVLQVWVVQAGVATAVRLDGTTQGGITTVNVPVVADALGNSTGYYHVEINASSTQADFYVTTDSMPRTLVCSISTNLPTHSLSSRIQMIKSAGVTARSVAVDYTRWRITPTTARTP